MQHLRMAVVRGGLHLDPGDAPLSLELKEGSLQVSVVLLLRGLGFPELGSRFLPCLYCVCTVKACAQ